jgi:hypothetical protein
MIAITDNTELNQYGFEGNRFRRKTRDMIGGYEWGGPCPVCGGTDRCIVSNGLYWCRHAEVCGCMGSLEARGNVQVDPQAKMHTRMVIQEEKERQARDQARKIAALNRSRIWQVYHRALLEYPEMISNLNAEGISQHAIKRYQLGYCPAFPAYNHDLKKVVNVPAFSIPHFSMNRKGWCLNIRMRILDESFAENVAKYLPYRANLPTLFFPAFTPKDKEVVIIEGEKKAIVLQRYGIPAIGLWGIYAVKQRWIPWLTRRFEKRYLVYDADNWGVISATYHQAKVLKAKPVFLNLPGKVDDLLVSGQMTADELIRQIKE